MEYMIIAIVRVWVEDVVINCGIPSGERYHYDLYYCTTNNLMINNISEC